MTMLAVAPSGSGYPAVGGSTTPTVFALLDHTASAPDFVANTHVVSMHLSLETTARVELTIGRAEAFASGGYGSETSRWFSGNSTDTGLPAFSALESPDIHQVLGRYYFNGSLQLNFRQEVESLRDAETGTDQAFCFTLKRIDDVATVNCHVNVWYEVYR